MTKTSESSNMFSNLHQQQSHPFHLSTQSQTTVEDSSTTTVGPIQKPDSTGPTQQPTSATVGDVGTVEVARKPRGRPRGSKNKPKPPVIITREPGPVMSPIILQVIGGSDVVKALRTFSIRTNTGFCVLSGKGAVVNVTLRQPSCVANATAVTFYGRFDILSISATVFPNSSVPFPNDISLSIAGPQGQIIGGFLAGSLISAGPVVLNAFSFNNPSHHRLSLEEDLRNNNSVSGGGGVQLPPPVSVNHPLM